MTGKSILKTNRMVHCACEVVDLKESRKLFEEVLGLEIVVTGPKTMDLRLNSEVTIHVIETGERREGDKHGSHMGFDVATEEEVDAAREKLLAVQEQYGIKKVARTKHGHGNYSFYFVDRDDNHWEILDNPKGGYSWRFEQGGDLERPFLPNNSDAEYWRELVDPETNEMKPTR
ncbi:MAG: VOC family protein [Rhodospirillales bacterium]|nr:VOC family protein [Rhodospirillales bacterium]